MLTHTWLYCRSHQHQSALVYPAWLWSCLTNWQGAYCPNSTDNQHYVIKINVTFLHSKTISNKPRHIYSQWYFSSTNCINYSSAERRWMHRIIMGHGTDDHNYRDRVVNTGHVITRKKTHNTPTLFCRRLSPDWEQKRKRKCNQGWYQKHATYRTTEISHTESMDAVCQRGNWISDICEWNNQTQNWENVAITGSGRKIRNQTDFAITWSPGNSSNGHIYTNISSHSIKWSTHTVA